jgi:hypothetical protein
VGAAAGRRDQVLSQREIEARNRWFDPSPSSGESRAKRFSEHFDDEVVKNGR